MQFIELLTILFPDILPDPQFSKGINDAGTHYQTDQKTGEGCHRRAKGDVAKDIKKGNQIM